MRKTKSITPSEVAIENADKKERVLFQKLFYKVFLMVLFILVFFATFNLGKSHFGSDNLPNLAVSVFVALIPTALFAFLFFRLTKEVR